MLDIFSCYPRSLKLVPSDSLSGFLLASCNNIVSEMHRF